MIVVFLAGYLALTWDRDRTEQMNSATGPAVSQGQNQGTTTAPAQDQGLESMFGLAAKRPGTKIYYSEKLGVGFTYLSASGEALNITESGNRISMGSQSIEVFEKAENQTLEQAVQSRFLKGYDTEDCFVTIDAAEQEGQNFVSAKISFPPSDDPNGPWWQNNSKCPQDYSETNSRQYFLMDKDHPDRFFFVKLGQETIATDGASVSGGRNWSSSIRILSAQQIPEGVPPVEEPKTTKSPLDIPELGVKVSFPEDFTVTKSDEKGRRGSYASYDFFNRGNSREPLLSELQLFSRDSISQFQETCKTEMCFEGDYPTTERYDGQKAALAKGVSYEGYALKTFNGRKWLVTDRKCLGDSCTIREYTTFFADTKSDVWITAWESKDREADALFAKLKFE